MNLWNRLKLGTMLAISSVLPMKSMAQGNSGTQNDAVTSEWRATVNAKDTAVFNVLQRDYAKIGVPYADSLAATAANKFAYLRDSVSEDDASAYLERIYSPIANRLAYDSAMVLMRDIRTDDDKTKELKSVARDGERASYASYKTAEKTRLKHKIREKQERQAWEDKKEQARLDNGATYVTPIFVASDTLRALDDAHVAAEAKRYADRMAAVKKTLKAWASSQKCALANAKDVKLALEAKLRRHDELDALIKKYDEDLKELGRLDIVDRTLTGEQGNDKQQVKGNKKNLKQNKKTDELVDDILARRQAAVSEQRSMPTREEIRARLQKIEKEITDLTATVNKIKSGEITITPGTEIIPFESSELAEKAGLKKEKGATQATPTRAAGTPTRPAATSTNTQGTPTRPAKSNSEESNTLIFAPARSSKGNTIVMPAITAPNYSDEINDFIANMQNNSEKVVKVTYKSGAKRFSYTENDNTLSSVIVYPEESEKLVALIKGNTTSVYFTNGKKTTYEVAGNGTVVTHYDEQGQFISEKSERSNKTSAEIFQAIGLYEKGGMEM